MKLVYPKRMAGQVDDAPRLWTLLWGDIWTCYAWLVVGDDGKSLVSPCGIKL